MELENVYRSFRRVQSGIAGRGYRMPKDFEKHLANRMSEINRAAIYKISDYFRTKWKNIDSDMYFQCGFELNPNFSYNKFFDHRIIKLYIHKDKSLKRDAELKKKNLIESVKFVKKFMADHKIPTFNVYCKSQHDNKSFPVRHYINNKISGFFLTWLIHSRLVLLSEDEKAVVPYILEKYRENIDKLLDINNFLKMLKEKL